MNRRRRVGFQRLDDGRIAVRLPAAVRSFVAAAAERLRDVGTAPGSPGFARLFGRIDETADADDPAYVLARQLAVDEAVAAVAASTEKPVIDLEEAEAWLAVLGMTLSRRMEELGVRTEADRAGIAREDEAVIRVVYALQAGLIDALDEREPAPRRRASTARTVGVVGADGAEIDGVTVELVAGDIVRQPDVDAVVNAANAQLLPGGGVAGAIHRAAGPELAEECRPLAPISPGEAVITGGHRLANPYVIHCLGPVYGVDRPEDELLAACYRHSLELADRHGLRSVAFPAISTGAFGYPMERAAEVALGTVLKMVGRLESVRKVRFVLTDEGALQVHRAVLQHLLEQ